MKRISWFVLLLSTLVTQCLEKSPTVTFNNGIKIPILGLGTSLSKPNEVFQAIKDAIDIGYRHFDCAQYYANQEEIGKAIAEKISEGVVKREELFITSKVWSHYHNPAEVEEVLKIILDDLGIHYLDLYLIHIPVAFKKVGKESPKYDFVDTWLAMEQVYKNGLAKSIGVSNFNKKQIERILEKGTIVPVTNQVECHPYLNQQKLIDFCRSKNITITAHTPLGFARSLRDKPNVPVLLKNPKLEAIASKLNKTPAQIMIRYQVQRGVIVIPKSVNKTRIAENFDVFDFELSDGDVATINGMDINGRIVTINTFKAERDYPFLDEY